MDLIDRQDAIDAVTSLCDDCDSGYCGSCRVNYPGEKDVVKVLKDLPSAQPEPTTEIQEILNYLDTTLRPIVSPDNWNVYAELHDMVSKLPSVQPETKKGKWIRNDNGTYSCSVCHSWIPEEQHHYARYCLYCGADMRGEKDD